jgi:alanine racemase
MSTPPSRTPPQAEAHIDLAAIRANTQAIAARVGAAAVCAVVKADGYGHGAVPAARAALAGGATHLGVCTLREAHELRAAGVDAPILAWLYGADEEFAPALEAGIALSAASTPQLEAITAAAKSTGAVARVHIKLDTGLGRGGAGESAWGELLEAAARAEQSGVLTVTGLWSHLACADEPGHPSIALQRARFETGLERAEALGLTPQLRHLANSAAALSAPETHYDMVRVGLALYGLSPFPGTERRYGLTPAMTLRGRVILTKRVPAGYGVAYGHTYTTERETTLALVPLGYADGVPRAASSRGPVTVNGARYRIAGRVSMDQIVLDVGDAPVAPGDMATLFGPGHSGEAGANDWAELLGTISYEIVARLGSRVIRTYTPFA